MWYLAYALALAGVVFTSYNLAQRYSEPTTVYDDFQIFGYQGPFPNVTLCAPELRNRSRLEEILVVPPKVRRLAERKNLNLKDVVEFAMDYWRMDVSERKYENELYQYAAYQIMASTSDRFAKGFSETMLETIPECRQILSDCYFEGRKFDCCRAVQYIYFDSYVCYHISMNRIAEFGQLTSAMGGQTEDTIHEDKSGLAINVTIDWKMAVYAENVAKNGFLVVVGPTATAFSDPIAIPMNADASIVLSPPRRMQELTQCRREDEVPPLDYFDHYDQYGINCIIDKVLQLFVKEIGCDLGFYGHEPGNGTQCSASLLLGAARMSFSERIDQQFDVKLLEKEYQRYIRLYGSIQITQFINTVCQPICQRWQYRITSASYGFVQLRDQRQWDRDPQENRSWSRLRVFFPEAAYQLHSEKSPIPKYVAVCDVGGVLGVYLGLSMITLTQIVAYGVFVFYSMCAGCRKKNKVGPCQATVSKVTNRPMW